MSCTKKSQSSNPIRSQQALCYWSRWDLSPLCKVLHFWFHRYHRERSTGIEGLTVFKNTDLTRPRSLIFRSYARELLKVNYEFDSVNDPGLQKLNSVPIRPMGRNAI